MENEQNSQQNISSTPVNSSKKYLYLVIGLLILAGVGYGVWNAQNKQKSSVSGEVSEKTVNLSDSEKQRLEAQIKGYESQIKGLSGSEFNAERAKLHLQIAGVQYKLGKYSDAVKSLELAAPENRDNVRFWYMSTLVYRDMGNLPKALESAQKMVDLDKENANDVSIYIDLATTAGTVNEQAKDLFTKSSTSVKQDIKVIISYAKFLEKIGDKQGAIDMWTNAGQQDPKEKTNYDAEIARLQK